MGATDARDLLIAAVRRDLWGQHGPADNPWPGSIPRVLGGPDDAGVFSEWREVTGPFVDDEGNEILHGSPLRRYGIGVLFPGLSRGLEQQLDAVQAEPDTPPGTEPEGEQDPPLRANEPEPAPAGPADVDDAADEPGTAGRPRSMAVSFLVVNGAGNLTLRVTGGRYEPFTVKVAGEPAQFWRRRPINLEVNIPASGAGFRQELDPGGRLRLALGASYRPHDAGTIVTAFVHNISPGGIDLAAATATAVFQARLEVQAGAGAVLDYPTTDIRDAEDRSLDLLYHRHPVRAVGHGCNAACVDGPAGSTVVGEQFPVEVVRSPVPDAIDEDGTVLAVDMDGLGRWDADARAEVDAVFAAYGRWTERRRAEIQSLPERHHAAAAAHVDRCAEFLSDAQRGWQHAQEDPSVRQVPPGVSSSEQPSPPMDV